MRVRTGDGVLLVAEAPAGPWTRKRSDTEAGWPRGYVAYWADGVERSLYVYGRVVSAPADLGEAVLRLGAELGVDVNALADAEPLVARGIEQAAAGNGSPGDAEHSPERAASAALWHPATERTVLIVLGFDGSDESLLAAGLDPDKSDIRLGCIPPQMKAIGAARRVIEDEAIAGSIKWMIRAACG